MIRYEQVPGESITVCRSEVYRYLGYGGQTETGGSDIVEGCIREVEKHVSCKACYDIFPVTAGADGDIDLGFCRITSKDLQKNLRNCSKIILFAATIGIEIDRIIARYARLSPAHGVAVQAAGAAAIEAWCDLLCEKFKKLEEAWGKSLRPRFSPGYGDLPLQFQSTVFRALDCPKKIGVTLTESLMMVPTKSVSAVVGICDEAAADGQNKCVSCQNRQCEFRRINL